MRITLKKVIAFLCCLVPFGAPAADYPGGLAIGENTGSVAVPETDNVLNLGENGLSVYGYAIIGEAGQGGKGQLYAEQTSGTFTIQSAGNVNVGGLIVKDNALLGIKGTTDSNIDLNLGTVMADGGLQIDEHINTVTATGITAKKMLSITANSADLGTVTVGGADSSLMLDVNGMLKMNDFKYTGTANNTGTITAGDIRVDGSIQNLADSGALNITATDAHGGNYGDIEIQVNVENKSTKMMTISGGAITVNGTMSQDTGGTLKIDSKANLSVLGTDTGGVSFVNKGTFDGNVSGTTTFVHGVDLSGMTASNEFKLTTGSLDLGTMRDLQLTHGTVDITTTSNSALSFATVANETDGKVKMNSAGNFTAETLKNNSEMEIRAVDLTADELIVGNVAKTTLSATNALTLNGDISNAGTTMLTGENITLQNVTNTGTMTIKAPTDTTGQISIAGNLVSSGNTYTLLHTRQIRVTGNITNSGNAVTEIFGSDTAGGDIQLGQLLVSGGTLNLKSLTGGVATSSVSLTGGTITVDSVTRSITATNNVEIAGSLSATGAVASGDGDMSVGATGTPFVLASTGGNITIGGNINVDNGAGIKLIANNISSHDVVNNGTITLGGRSLDVENTFNATNLYQKFTGVLNAGDVNIDADSYRISATDFNLGGNLNATNLIVFAVPATHLNANIAGNLSGGVTFANLGQMHVGGDYAFTDTSKVFANISNKSSMAGLPNYWSSVSLADDTLGQITNATSGDGALITVDGKFTSDLSLGLTPSGGIGGGASDQIGIALRELADAGDAIWLVYAQGGITESGDKLRNLNVVICNASGSICYDYFDGTPAGNSSAYLTMRDTDGNGTSDSIYVVFDPRFGGPVELFKIQPIVARNAEHTDGEYVSAGALDNIIADQMAKQGFTGRHAIELLPVLFRGTNLETMANELYGRMEHYNTYRDSAPLSRFSRLFQAREIEQVAGSVILNEHTSARSFEDHMLDEFIWNRNRNLKKAWVDAEYGMLFQKVSDGKHADGNRFNITGGFDWQHTNTLILGLAGRVSHTSTDVSDAMNLGYTTENPFIAGHVDAKVANTNIGLGGYLMQTLGEKTRAYGNAFLDLHVFDITRHQTFVNGTIDGSGTAFALNTEWGLLHDWLNQYIVGNMYARAGYNFGFSVTEKVGGHDYMKMKSDGYLSFTPGYSLTAQKRIYPSVWFQVRPYATIGVEYDVLGAPDNAKYKFATAKKFTSYDIDIDPLWANIGGGVEMLSVTGFQVGLDYRYQYNQDIQLHNIRVSGSYRF